MKNLNELKKQYEKLGQEIERLERGVDWVPEEGEKVWVTQGNGDVDEWSFTHVKKFLENNALFQTKEQAEKASVLMRRSNAIIRACLLVDPDYEPDWSIVGAVRWTAMYDLKLKKWVISCEQYCRVVVACVSTEEKAQQVCELLTKWGIK
jgi:hypothetical protein